MQFNKLYICSQMNRSHVQLLQGSFHFSFHCLNDVRENALSSICFPPCKMQPHSLPGTFYSLSAHHVVGKDRQQQLKFIRVDVDVGLDCVP